MAGTACLRDLGIIKRYLRSSLNPAFDVSGEPHAPEGANTLGRATRDSV
jgi:hypothetical protein